MEISPEFITGFVGVLLATSFVRCGTVFTIFRYGLGLRGMMFGIITALLALLISVTTLQRDLGGTAVDLFNPKSISSLDVEKTFRPILEKRVDPTVLSDLKKQLYKGQAQDRDERPFSLLLLAFVLSELKAAFQIGISLLIPFVVIDIVCANVLSILGVTQLKASVVSLPLKLSLFFAVDGWNLLIQKLLSGAL